MACSRRQASGMHLYLPCFTGKAARQQGPMVRGGCSQPPLLLRPSSKRRALEQRRRRRVGLLQQLLRNLPHELRDTILRRSIRRRPSAPHGARTSRRRCRLRRE